MLILVYVHERALRRTEQLDFLIGYHFYLHLYGGLLHLEKAIDQVCSRIVPGVMDIDRYYLTLDVVGLSVRRDNRLLYKLILC